MTLPPLPEPAYSGAYLLTGHKLPPAFTEAQLLAYRAAVIEICAAVCESTSFSMPVEEWQEITKREMSIKAMLACADAIRSMNK